MMKQKDMLITRLKSDLKRVSTLEKARASRRYFPSSTNCIGATATDITMIIANFQSQYSSLSADDYLCLTQDLLSQAQFSEEVLLAFGLINKFVKKNYDDDLLLRFEFWLENYASNWSHVDDLCIKTIYQFLMARPYLIEQTQHWAHSNVSWCRRASNVVWVKFIARKIGQSTYYLDKELVFKNCDLLITDDDNYVQKSVGWLLKVTSVQHQGAVIEYIQRNCHQMERATIRYAIEKMDSDTRQWLLAATK